MSFGFGVGDFLDLYDRAKEIVEACRDGPGDVRDLGTEVEAMQVTLYQLSQDATDPESLLNRKGIQRKQDLDQIIINCQNIIKEAKDFVDKHSSAIASEDKSPRAVVRRIWHSYRAGSVDLDTLRERFTFWTSVINVFQTSLNSAAVGRIELKVDEILARLLLMDPAERTKTQDTASVMSLASDEDDETAWDELRADLVAVGVSTKDVESHKQQIIDYITGLIHEAIPEAVKPRKPRWEANSRHFDVSRVTFSLAKVLFGTFKSTPSCMLVLEFKCTSKDVFGSFLARLTCFGRPVDASKPSDSSDIGNVTPHLLAFAPTSMENGQVKAETNVLRNTQANSVRNNWTITAVVHWGVAFQKWGPPRAAARAKEAEFDRAVRIALVVEHGNRDFVMDIGVSGVVKEGWRRFGFGRLGGTQESVTIQPQPSVTVLDGIDLEAEAKASSSSPS